MTEDEARKLATRIIDTWPTGPKAYVWRDVLIDLDPTHAATAYRTCVRVATRAPSPADFLDAYAEAQHHSAATTAPDTATCGYCRGALDERGHPTGTGCAHCRIPDFTTGRQLAETMRTRPLEGI